jgi:8-oxo-dGTP diphosphatase
MPAGHIEPGETPNRAAVRELFEEAGVVNSSLTHLCDYSVTSGDNTGYGRLYHAEVEELDPQLKHEIEELKFTSELPLELTYPEVQTTLFARLFTLP